MLFRVIAASPIFVAGLVMAIMFLSRGQAAAAIVPFVCGLIVSGVVVSGFRSLGSEGYRITVGMATMTGLFIVCFSSNLFMPKLQEGYARVLTSFVEIETGIAPIEILCPQALLEVKRISTLGLKACALQHNTDALSATVELSKGIQFGPGLTLLDSASTLAQDENANWCARAFRDADRLCPSAFSSIDQGARKALLEAAK